MTNLGAAYSPTYITPIVARAINSFTRPNDTIAYASGDLVANSTVAGSVVPVPFVISRSSTSGVSINRVRLAKSGTGITNASFRLHLFMDVPTLNSGDNAAISFGGLSNYIGQIDVTVGQALTDGAKGFSDNNVRSITTFPAAANTLYGLLEARGAYTPIAQEIFTITLECTLE